MDFGSIASSLASVLRLVRDATVSLSVPLQPGVLFPGLSVRPGTTARLQLEVRHGQFDLRGARLELTPALDGPLFVAVRGIGINADGRVTIRIFGLPDLQLGPKLPSSVEELAELIERMHSDASLRVRVLGIPVAAVDVDTGTSALSHTIDSAQSPGAPLLDQLRIADAGLSLNAGMIRLAEWGEVEVDDGTRLHARGTLQALRARAHVAFTSFTASVESARVEEARGSFDLSLELDRDPRELPRLAVTLEHGNIDTGRVAARRGNGDFANLSASSLRELIGTVELCVDPIAAPAGARLTPRGLVLRADVPRAMIDSARVTVPFAQQSMPVELEHTEFSGQLRILGTRLRASGDVVTHAQLNGLRTLDRAMAVDVQHLSMDGPASIELDSGEGVRVRSRELRVRAHLEDGALRSLGDHLAVHFGTGSGFDLALEEAHILRSGHFTFRGHGEVAFKQVSLGFDSPRIRLRGGDAQVRIKSHVELDSRNGIGLENATVRVDVGELAGQLEQGERFALNLEGRNRFEGTITHGRIGLDVILFDCAPGSKLTALIDRGGILLPGEVRVKIREGTRAHARFSPVRIGTDGPAALTASVHLDARLGIDDDAPQPLWWPVQLTRLTGVGETLELEIEKLSLLEDGRFAIDGVRLGLNAKASRIEGEAETAQCTAPVKSTSCTGSSAT